VLQRRYPTGAGVWGGGSAPPRKFFWGFWAQNGVFLCTLGSKFPFFSRTKTVQKYTRNARTAMEIDLHAIKSITQECLSL